MRRRGGRWGRPRPSTGRLIERLRELRSLGLSEWRPIERPQGAPERLELATARADRHRLVAVAAAPRASADLVGWVCVAAALSGDEGATEGLVAAAAVDELARRAAARLAGSDFPLRIAAIPALAAEAPELCEVEAYPQRGSQGTQGFPVSSLLDRVVRVIEGAALVTEAAAVRRTPAGYVLYVRGAVTLLVSADGDAVTAGFVEPERDTLRIDEGNFPRLAVELQERVVQLAQDPRLLDSEGARRDRAIEQAVQDADARLTGHWLAWSQDGRDPVDWVGIDRNGRPLLGWVRPTLRLSHVPALVAAREIVEERREAWAPGSRGELRIAFSGDSVEPLARAALVRLGLEIGPALDVRPAPPRREAEPFARAPYAREAERESEREFAREAERGGEREPERDVEREREGEREAEREGEREQRRGRRRGRRRRRGRGEGPAAAAPIGELGSDVEAEADEEESTRFEEDRGFEGVGREDASALEESEPRERDEDEESTPFEEEPERGERRRWSGDTERPAAALPFARVLEDDGGEEEPEEGEEPDEVEPVEIAEPEEGEPGEDESVAAEIEATLAEGSGAEAEEEIEPARRPRRARSAIVVRDDLDAILAALVLARERRGLMMFRVCRQDQLMEFFKTGGTDLDDSVDVLLIGFTAQPLPAEILQTAALYRGRLQWFDHHEWPIEDLERLREAIGRDAIVFAPNGSSPLAAVMQVTERRSRFTDKLVELSARRLPEAEMERWGYRVIGLIQRLARQPGEHRPAIQPVLIGKPVELPAAPDAYQDEARFVESHEPRVFYFGEYAMAVAQVPEKLDAGEVGRRLRLRTGARLSLTTRVGDDLLLLGCNEERRHLNVLGMIEHLAAKLPWSQARPAGDRAGRLRVLDLPRHPERLEAVIGEIVRHKSILYG